jgi:hypothetical protein
LDFCGIFNYIKINTSDTAVTQSQQQQAAAAAAAAACIRVRDLDDRGREKCTSTISDFADKLTAKNLIDSSADCRAPPFQQWNVNFILDPFII